MKKFLSVEAMTVSSISTPENDVIEFQFDDGNVVTGLTEVDGNVVIELVKGSLTLEGVKIEDLAVSNFVGAEGSSDLFNLVIQWRFSNKWRARR